MYSCILCDVRSAKWFEEAEVGEHIPGGEDEVEVDELGPRAEQLSGVMDMVIDENHVLAMREGQGGNRNDIYAERRAMYERVPRNDPRRGQKGRDLEPAMDDLINAKMRPGLGCFRRPPTVYFGNDRMGEHGRVVTYVVIVFT